MPEGCQPGAAGVGGGRGGEEGAGGGLGGCDPQCSAAKVEIGRTSSIPRAVDDPDIARTGMREAAEGRSATTSRSIR